MVTVIGNLFTSKKTMVPSRRGFDMGEKKRNFNTPSLKRVLRELGVLENDIKVEFKQ
jgi:hypothetical protein